MAGRVVGDTIGSFRLRSTTEEIFQYIWTIVSRLRSTIRVNLTLGEIAGIVLIHLTTHVSRLTSHNSQS